MSSSDEYRETPASRLMMLMQGSTITTLLRVSVEFDLPGRISSGTSATDIAESLGVSSSDLNRILMALASLGVFERNPNGTFNATGMSRLLRQDHPASLAPMAAFYGSPWRTATLSALTDALRDGTSAFEHRFERPLFEYLDEPGTARREFDEAMTALSARDNLLVQHFLKFDGNEVLVDLGGGAGTLLGDLLTANPAVRGVLVERESALAAAARRFDELEISDRVELFYGDFLSQELPAGDIYLLKRIIHDWPDEAARILLSSCREVAPPGARIVIIDALLEPEDSNLTRRLSDIEMLLLTGGRERSETEMRALLEESGWALERVVRTGSFVDLTIGIAALDS